MKHATDSNKKADFARHYRNPIVFDFDHTGPLVVADGVYTDREITLAFPDTHEARGLIEKANQRLSDACINGGHIVYTTATYDGRDGTHKRHTYMPSGFADATSGHTRFISKHDLMVNLREMQQEYGVPPADITPGTTVCEPVTRYLGNAMRPRHTGKAVSLQSICPNS